MLLINIFYENGVLHDYIVENPGHPCDSYDKTASPNFYISIALILMHLLQPIVLRVQFFKENISLCVAFLIVIEAVFGFMILAVGA